MVRKNFLTTSSLLLATSFIAGCSMFSTPPEKEVVTVTEVVKPNIPLAQRPKPLSLSDVQFFVVTNENFEEFKDRFTEENGDLVFVAVSIRGYESLSLNMADLRRYILQQKEVIVYYEQSLTEPKINEQQE